MVRQKELNRLQVMLGAKKRNKMFGEILVMVFAIGFAVVAYLIGRDRGRKGQN